MHVALKYVHAIAIAPILKRHLLGPPPKFVNFRQIVTKAQKARITR
jgi:hypothetical protein